MKNQIQAACIMILAVLLSACGTAPINHYHRTPYASISLDTQGRLGANVSAPTPMGSMNASFNLWPFY